MKRSDGGITTGGELISGLTEGMDLPRRRIYNGIDRELLSSISATFGWHLVVDEGAEASASFHDGALEVEIADGGRTWYAIQLCCLPLPISAGFWSVEFDARSDGPRRLILDIAHVGDDWFAFAGRPFFRLTGEWTTYRFAFFNEKRVEPSARFEFNLGGEGASASFRNVRIGEE
jgi:hypothetical protein